VQRGSGSFYNLAHVFDDALIVGIAVYTLNRQKLQEKQGRWLKLASGVVIIVLGLMLLLAPEHLVLALERRGASYRGSDLPDEPLDPVTKAGIRENVRCMP
jgi:hypothetical protein